MAGQGTENNALIGDRGAARKLVLMSLVFFAFSVLPVSRAAQAATSQEPIQPIAGALKDENNKVIELGRRLFFEKRLSHDNSVACASCHDLQAGGVDHRVKSVGIGQSIGDINAPTVFNSGLNFVQFWDGRAATLEDQIEGPVNHPKEMGSNWNEIAQKLSKDALYVSLFSELDSGPITGTRIKAAIAAYERVLTTPNSKFDRFLRGDATVLTPVEKRGYQKFKTYGCIACHQGANVGGNMFQVMGLVRDYFKDRGSETDSDQGRFNVTHLEQDRHVFRVPSLRNVELTSPYFHDGSARTLRDAILVMGKYQLGRRISEIDAKDIELFLKTLTGTPDPVLVRDPGTAEMPRGSK